jgi:ribosomal protein S18 acetylase RimI-like enzyme
MASAEDIDISLCGPADHGDVVAMNRAMDLHYNPALEPSSAEDVGAMLARIAAEPDLGTQVALARRGGEPIGIAFFALIHPGRRLGGVLFVKDLFVVPEARGLGVGEALMRFLARHARAKGIRRLDLTAEPHNEGALRFYERLGMTVRPAIYYRIENEALEALGGPLTP